MGDIFLKILNLSLTASWLILAVILARALIKKAPKWVACALWALVAIRLMCPYSIESSLSLISGSEPISYDFVFDKTSEVNSNDNQSELSDGNSTMNENSASPDLIVNTNQVIGSNNLVVSSDTNSISESVEGIKTARISSKHTLMNVLSILWIAGIVFLILYAIISSMKLKKTIGASIAFGHNILACDEVKSPFILGIIKPIIYVPSSLSGKAFDYVIKHEKTHIKRGDHLWKPLGYVLLTVYWFNPLCWVAYILLCRDIELACDEMVIKDMDNEGKIAYSEALLNCSFHRKRVATYPLAFGEVGIKERVKNVLNYKKPAFWIVVIAIVIGGVVGICFMTTKSSKKQGITLPRLTDEQLEAFYQEGVEKNSDKLLGINYFEVVSLDFDGQLYTMSRNSNYLERVYSADLSLNSGYEKSMSEYPLEKICDVYGDVFVKPVFGDANADGKYSDVFAWYDDRSKVKGECRQATLWKFGDYDTKNIVILAVEIGELLHEPEYELYVFYHLNDITLKTGKDLLNIILDPMKAGRYGVQRSWDPLIVLSGDKPEDILFIGDLYQGTVVDASEVENMEVICRILIQEKEPYGRQFYFDYYGDGYIGYCTPEKINIIVKTEWDPAKVENVPMDEIYENLTSEKEPIFEAYAEPDYIISIQDGAVCVSDGKVAPLGNIDEALSDFFRKEESIKYVSSFSDDSVIVIDKKGKISSHGHISEIGIQDIPNRSYKLADHSSHAFVLVDEEGGVYAKDFYSSYTDDYKIDTTIKGWNNVVDAVATDDVICVLFKDGTVDYVCSNDINVRNPGLFDVLKTWDNIVDIEGYSSGCIFGLKADGTIVVSNDGREGLNKYNHITNWKNITSISKGINCIFAVSSDGKVFADGNYSEKQAGALLWNNVAGIDVGSNNVVGITKDEKILMTE